MAAHLVERANGYTGQVTRRHRLPLLLVSAFFSLAGVAHAGVDVWTSNGPEGGILTALVVAPSNPSTLYTSTIGGGVFKSTNAGATWRPVNNGLTDTWVYSLAVDPSNASIVYAGANEGGVLKSTDGGSSWTQMNSGLVFGYGSTVIYALVVDPSHPSTVYANGPQAVFKSTNGGSTWKMLYKGLPYHVAPTGEGVYSPVRCLAVDPSNPSTLYADTDHSVFKSTDGGDTWTAANNGLPSTVSPSGVTYREVLSLVVDPSNSSNVYAGTGNGMYRSTDAGGSWVAADSGFSDPSMRSYVITVAVDRTHPSTLYAGTGAGGVLKSTDAGANWTPVNTGLASDSVTSIALDPSNPSTLYAATTFSRPSNGGVFKSTDGGASWTTSSKGINANQSPCLAVAPSTPSTIYACGWTGVFKSTDAGSSWATAGPPISGVNSLAVHPTDPSTLYATTSYEGVLKSTDGGTSWSVSTNGLSTRLVTSLTLDPSTPTTVYVGTYAGVFKSTDAGANWAAANAGLAVHINCVVVDPTRSSTVYASAWTTYRNLVDGVYKSTDAGTSWVSMNSGLAEFYANVTVLAIDPSNPTTLYAGTDGYGVFKSTDGAASWTQMRNGLVEIPVGFENPFVNGLAIDPIHPSIIYAGVWSYSGGGVYKSTDGAASWKLMRNGLTVQPNGLTPIHEIHAVAVDPLNPANVYAGTRGNSVLSIQQICDVSENPANRCVCGDGVVNRGVEQCDDGNTSETDSCKNNCTLNVCGDGIIRRGVEQCDDGNTLDGDGCSARCESELIPGGGPARTDCMHEWLTAPVTARDRKRFPTNQLRCVDDDPTCDFGEPNDGMCTFRVELCFNNADVRFPGCTPTDIARIDLLSPSQAAPRDDFDTWNRDALEAALETFGGAVLGYCTNRGPQRGRSCTAKSDCDSLPGNRTGVCRGRFMVFDPPNGDPNTCTDFVPITVPRGGTKRLTLTATPSNDPVTGRKRTADSDMLTLTCAVPR